MRKKGEMLNAMLLLVAQKFAGKLDRGGNPYILHCLKVMHYCRTDDEETQCIALGHDLFEDTDVVPADLYALGMSETVVWGIGVLTKRLNETYEEFILRILEAGPTTRLVKRADIRHNTDIRRLKGLTDADFERMKKYQRAYTKLDID